MPTAVQTLAGTTLALSSSLPSTFDLNAMTGYPSLSWTTVGEVTDLPEFGKSYNLVTHLPVAGRQIEKFKGSYNNGTLTVTMARDDNDTGQAEVLSTGIDSDNSYAFRVQYQDATEDYFTAKIMSFTSVGGGADSIVNRVMTLELDRDVVSDNT